MTDTPTTALDAVNVVAVKRALDALDTLQSKGNFSNGVVHNCVDEGDVLSAELFDEIRQALAASGLLSPPVGEGEWIKNAVNEIAAKELESGKDLSGKERVAIIARHAPTSNEELVEALDDLQQAEDHYRHTHNLKGGENMETGRAWDLMRRCGERARTALSKHRNR